MRPEGHVEFEDGKQEPWIVILDVDPANGGKSRRASSHKNQAMANLFLAKELAAQDPGVVALVKQANKLRNRLYEEHVDRLVAERGDLGTNPKTGRGPDDTIWEDTCMVCFKKGDHPDLRTAHAHGCTR